MAVQMIRNNGVVLSHGGSSSYDSSSGSSSYHSSYDSEEDVEEEEEETPRGRRPRFEIQRVAQEKAERLLEFLKTKAERKEYPVFSLTKLTEGSVKSKLISTEEKAIFHYYLGLELKKLVEAGKLVSSRGRGGGFRWVVEEEE